MTEKWHPQRKTADASIAILKTFIHHLKHPISRSTIETTVEKHPEFPQLSFTAIQKF